MFVQNYNSIMDKCIGGCVMLKKLFGKKEDENNVALYAPVSGETVLLEDVPDPVFSEKMMGDGIAIKPDSDIIYAPVDGGIMQMFPSKHAVGIKAANGAEIMIHIGLETVNLNGEGFAAHVQEGDHVKQGDKLISFDRDVIEKKAESSITPVIITNTAEMREITLTEKGRVSAKDDELLTVKR